ncbi:MAG: hypothetical protein CSB47_10955 [Proteobacteria bacterium]|nr:MAG: hypothetical protein CSB47_10955 [Pseudomonadota bacterium]
MSLTKTTIKLALPLAISLILAGCGGASSDNTTNGVRFGSATNTGATDTSSSTTGTGDNTSTDDETSDKPEVSSLIVYASSRTLLSDADADPNTEGSEPVTIYMMAKDKNNTALKGVTFTPSVDNGATLFPGEVSADGMLTTWLLVPDEPRNQTVNVSVKAGDITEKLSIDITGTNIQIDGAENISMDKPTSYTIKLKDASGRGLALQPVTITSDIPELTETELTTDSEGEAQFEIQPAQSGEYSLKAEALGSVSNKTIKISPNAFNLSSDTGEINVNEKQTIKLSWTADGAPKAGKKIYLSATRGIITTSEEPHEVVTTDSNGNASFEIESSTAGGTVITATDDSTHLSTSLPLEFIAKDPHYLNIQADPSLIAALGTSTIRAQVRDKNDNPVKNQVVVFNLNDTVDGKLSSSKAETDSSGQASVVYTAGKATSAKDGVVITSHLEGESTIEDQTTLTVGGRAARIVFGYDEGIAENAPFYTKSLGVIVTDNAGNPISGKQVDFTVRSTHYSKGILSGPPWQKSSSDPLCPSEDLNSNGWLNEGEDFNNSGYLEPTNSTTITNTGTTNESGQLVVEITYPQNHAWWETIEITAQVTVDGTEYIEKMTMVLPVLAKDVEKPSTPPNYRSPYGVGQCTEAP